MSELAQLNEFHLRIERERFVEASISDVFEALLEQLGPLASTPDDTLMSMKIEPFPGGRWWRDLGGGNGHLWGHVQAVKVPTLFELSGPMFMSHAVANNIQYRLEERDGSTVLRLVHESFGAIPDEAREGLQLGWDRQLEKIVQNAQGSK